MEKSVVSIVKNSNPIAAVRESLHLLGGAKAFAHKGDKILVKPNVSFPVSPEVSPEITHPDVIAALVRAFKENGASEVFVGDQPVWGVRSRDAFRISGVEDAVTRAGGEVCYFDEEDRIVVDVPDGKFFDEISIPKIVKEVDLIVNVPKMKTHFLMGATLGMKNLLGFLTFESRRKFHRKYDLAYVIADIAKTIRPRLTLIDGIIAMEGFGPHAGTLVNMGVVVTSKDIIAADAVGAVIMGLDPFEVPTTQVGVRYGLGTADLSNIRIIGETVENVKKHFKRAIIMCVSPYPNVDVFIGGMCPGCEPRIPSVPPNPELNKKYAVIIGRRAKVPTKVKEYDEIWLFGKCGIDSAIELYASADEKRKIRTVPGCPPLIWYAKQTLFKTLKEKEFIQDFTAR